MAKIYANRLIAGTTTWEELLTKPAVIKIKADIIAALIAKGHPELVPEE